MMMTYLHRFVRWKQRSIVENEAMMALIILMSKVSVIFAVVVVDRMHVPIRQLNVDLSMYNREVYAKLVQLREMFRRL